MCRLDLSAYLLSVFNMYISIQRNIVMVDFYTALVPTAAVTQGQN